MDRPRTPMTLALRRTRPARGYISSSVPFIVMSLVAFVALLYDGGGLMLAVRRADNYAQSAARVAVQEIDEASFRAGVVRIRGNDACVRARDFLASQGLQLSEFRISANMQTVALVVEGDYDGGFWDMIDELNRVNRYTVRARADAEGGASRGDQLTDPGSEPVIWMPCVIGGPTVLSENADTPAFESLDG